MGLADSGRNRPRMKSSISTGTSVMASSDEKPTASVLVQASGRNMRPSWASSRKTGRNETTMMTSEKKMAGPTCLAASSRICASRCSAVAGQTIAVETLADWDPCRREMAVAVFHHDNGGVHQHSDGQRQPAQRHDVGAHVQVIHRDERRNDGDGQRQNRDERRAEVEEENDDDQADDDRLFQQIALQGLDGFVNQSERS